MAFPEKSSAALHLERYRSPSLNIECGAWSYGQPRLQVTTESKPRTLRIGRYCSIAHDVEIFVGRQGRHLVDTLTTYPLPMAVSEALRRTGDLRNRHPELYEQSVTSQVTDLDVEIGHDVWVGAHAVIMAGVKIGTGAIIATGAVVTSDVPPYAVFGGVPAKLIRYRHEPAVILALLESRWWELDPDEIWRRCGSLVESRKVLDVLRLLREPRADNPPAPAAVAPPAAPVAPKPAPAPAVAAAAPAPAAAAPAVPPNLQAAIAALRPDLGNVAPVLSGLGLDDLTQLFSAEAAIPGPLPKWPTQDVQRRYTGGYGSHLMGRTRTFVQAMAAEGVFQKPDWRGLDFGCGWGRIASYMLTRGRPDQLDVCDAWQTSLDIIAANGFRNRAWLVPEVLAEGSVPAGTYDFCYAFSIFTHLSEAAMHAGLRHLWAALKPGGKLFVTVRHEDFFPAMVEQKVVQPGTGLDASGFWHIPYPGRTVYGEAVVSPAYMAKLCADFGPMRNVGLIEPFQHLYIIERR